MCDILALVNLCNDTDATPSQLKMITCNQRNIYLGVLSNLLVLQEATIFHIHIPVSQVELGWIESKQFSIESFKNELKLQEKQDV